MQAAYHHLRAVDATLGCGDDSAVICGQWSCAGLELEDVCYPVPARIGLHAHDTATIVIVAGGTFSHRRGSIDAMMTMGTVLFVPKHTPHAGAVLAAGARCLSIDISRDWLERRVDASIVLPLEPVVLGDASVASRAVALCEEVRAARPSDTLLSELTCALMDAAACHADRSMVPRWLVYAREMLREQSRSMVDVANVAEHAGVHPVHLSRAFHQHFGLTVTSYVTQLRVERARRALATTRRSIGAIGVSEGFCDHAYFTRIFRRYVGESPSDFRRRVWTSSASLGRADRNEGTGVDDAIAHPVHREARLQELS